MRKFWDFICILGLLFKLFFVLLERATTSRIIKHFKDKELLEIGTQLSFYYFLGFLIFFGWRIPELYEKSTGINGVGDFLAGLFSPIAFGWLIIGYLMQNKELKNSVEQTGEAQRLARDQLYLQVWLSEKEELEKFNSAQPIFFLREQGQDNQITIKNIGEIAFNIEVYEVVDNNLEGVEMLDFLEINSVEKINLSLSLPEDVKYRKQSLLNVYVFGERLLISYSDKFGNNHEVKVSVQALMRESGTKYLFSCDRIQKPIPELKINEH